MARESYDFPGDKRHDDQHGDKEQREESQHQLDAAELPTNFTGLFFIHSI